LARHLKDLPGEVKGDPGGVLGQAAKAIAADIHIETLPRLETFLTYAEQHARELKEGGKLSQSAEEVLALAVTGWARGDAAAEAKPKLARALWQLRELFAKKPPKKAEIVSHCNKHEISPDLLAQLIPFLPPPDAPAQIKDVPVKLDIEAPDTPGGEYWVQLPL